MQNPETRHKDGNGSSLCFPVHSFLDPEVTFTVPADYTTYGIADMIAHCFENFFSVSDCSLSDRFITAIIADAMEWGPKLMDNLHGYDERAAIMYDATMALNTMTGNGKGGGDWGVYGMGHILSLLHGAPHGGSLSIIFPAWMKHLNKKAEKRISRLETLFFGNGDVDATTLRFEEFFTRIWCPGSFVAGGDWGEFEEIVQLMIRNKVEGRSYKLTEDDYLKIMDLAK